MHTIAVKCAHLSPHCVALKRTTEARFRDAGRKSSSTSLTSVAWPMPLPCDAPPSPPCRARSQAAETAHARDGGARGGEATTLAPTSSAWPLSSGPLIRTRLDFLIPSFFSFAILLMRLRLRFTPAMPRPRLTDRLPLALRRLGSACSHFSGTFNPATQIKPTIAEWQHAAHL